MAGRKKADEQEWKIQNQTKGTKNQTKFQRLTEEEISQTELCRILDYDPGSGVLRFKIGHGKHAQGRTVATKKDGYLVFRFGGRFGRQLRAHRAIWRMMYGVWPVGSIDHINGDRSDNRLKNLRHVTHRDNIINMKLSKKNTSGYRGVTREHRSNKWVARIVVHGSGIYLGSFSTAKEASDAFESAAKKHFGEPFEVGQYRKSGAA